MLLHDEELAAVCVRACICHSHSASVEVQSFGNFCFEIFTPAAFAAHACAFGVAALDHEFIDNTVEDQTVIIAFFCQCFEVFNSLRCFFGEETHFHNTLGCFDHCNFFTFCRSLRLNDCFCIYICYCVCIVIFFCFFTAAASHTKSQYCRQCQHYHFLFHCISSVFQNLPSVILVQPYRGCQFFKS